MLSVIIPAYNEEKMIELTANTIHSLLQNNGIHHELIFIDDGSKDATWENIQKIKETWMKGVKFSKNFGKEAAIFAGLEHAKGECAVVIDCDLQHPPEKIVEMYKLWLDGYEIVEAVKTSRGKESLLHKACAGTFYKIISKATNIDMNRASDFKLLDRKAINVLLTMREKNSFFRALSSWIGFKTMQIEFDVQERLEGESKWSAISLIKYAISNITSFSTLPMQFATGLGVATFIISIVIGAIALIQKMLGQSLEGFTTVIILQLLFSSIIMCCLGIIGYYIAKIYEEIQGRPKYIVAKIHEINEDLSQDN